MQAGRLVGLFFSTKVSPHGSTASLSGGAYGFHGGFGGVLTNWTLINGGK